MDSAERLHQYAVENRREAQTVSPTVSQVGPFTVVLDPTDDAIERNIAIPHARGIEAPEHWIAPLRTAFASQGRSPAIRWIDVHAPYLAEALLAIGFSEHHRETALVCTPQMLRIPSSISGLTFETVTDVSPLAAVRENLDVNEFGFDPANAQPATDEQAAQFRATLVAARSFTARLHGPAVGAGMYTAPILGVTELAGIATLEAFRGQGIAEALTAHMTDSAFAHGCDLAFLTTSNPVARRVYERVGFKPVGNDLTYAETLPR